MLNILVDYPNEAEEVRIVEMTTSNFKTSISKVFSGADIMEFQDIVRRVPPAPYANEYAVRLARTTRLSRVDGETPDFIRDYVSWGAGPRASQYLMLAAKARAALHGKTFAGIEDIKSVVHPVLRHRIVTNFNAEADGLRADDLIDRLVETVPVNPSEAEQSGRVAPVFRSANAG
jgi:MoxR-like ATPase